MASLLAGQNLSASIRVDIPALPSPRLPAASSRGERREASKARQVRVSASTIMKLIIATQNQGKLREIKHLLKGVKFSIVSLNELDRKFNIKENGKTFFENAVKKTKSVSQIYKDDLVAGEDSGLAVDYLDGKPGVFSKRYSGKNWTYHKNNLKILKELNGLERKKRKAHFICSLVLMKNGKILRKIEGRLNGFIANEIRGKGGFGYDPIFYLPNYKKTVAQLPLQEKNKISHRAKAFRKLKKYLKRLNLKK